MHLRARLPVLVPVLSLVVALTASSAAAGDQHRVEDERFVSDRIRISLDFQLATFDTSAQVDSATLGTGDGIDLENDLGMDKDSYEGTLSGHFKIANRHRISFSYEGFDRSATKTLAHDFQIGDHVFLAGSSASADSKLFILHLDYRYDFVHKKNVEFGIGAGIVYLESKFDIEADIIGGTGTVRASDNVSVGYPVPELGLGFDWFPGEHFVVRGGLTYFQASISDIDGSWMDGGARVEWMPWKHAGFGLGYRFARMNIDFDHKDSGHSGNLDYREAGLTGGFSFAW